ncbi:hypothetical protein ACVWYG_001448 [Pedobacter sp. UYEF25]
MAKSDGECAKVLLKVDRELSITGRCKLLPYQEQQKVNVAFFKIENHKMAVKIIIYFR